MYSLLLHRRFQVTVFAGYFGVSPFCTSIRSKFSAFYSPYLTSANNRRYRFEGSPIFGSIVEVAALLAAHLAIRA
jgi:hypothetical protein